MIEQFNKNKSTKRGEFRKRKRRILPIGLENIKKEAAKVENKEKKNKIKRNKWKFTTSNRCNQVLSKTNVAVIKKYLINLFFLNIYF